MLRHNLSLAILLLILFSIQAKAQSGFDLQKMRAKYEQRVPALDSMLGNPETVLGLPYESFTTKTTDGVTIAGWYVPNELNKGTTLMVHGFNMNKSHMLNRAKTLHALGQTVVLIDLRARGESSGDKTSQGEKSALDVMAGVNHLKAHWKNIAPLSVYGFSHGGRTLLYSSNQLPANTKIILESPPYSLTNSFKRTYKMPKAPDLDDGSLQMALVGIKNKPVLLMIGDQDAAITVEEAEKLLSFSTHLFSKMQVFTKTSHNVHIQKNSVLFDEIIASFLTQN